jgi:hypothetical protein
MKFFSAIDFLQFLVIKTMDPNRYSAYNAGSGSGLNEYRSETLVLSLSVKFLCN